MPRYTESLTLPLPAGRHLEAVGTVGSVGSLRVRVRNLRVEAYSPAASSFSAPPRFTGYVRSDRDKTALTGQVKESLTNVMWVRVDLLVLVLMGALVALGVLGFVTSDASSGLPPLLIGLLGLPAFLWLYPVHQRQRCHEWRNDVTALTELLNKYVAGTAG